MNTLIELLNNAGYKNTNTNRERAVRNMNLLLDSGIMSIVFIPADEYNAKEGGKSFWFNTTDGKRLCTAYKVTLYGKQFYGQFIQKSRTTKYLKSVAFDGTREYGVDTDYYDNYYLDISDIQLRVARLLSIIKEKGDFLSPQLFEAKGKCSCGKCHGVGIIPAFSYYANGICFDCGGSGIDRDTLKKCINSAIHS